MIEIKDDYSSIDSEFWKSLKDIHISEKNKCSTCKYSGTISGDAHLCCNHPAIIDDRNTMQRILQSMSNNMYNTNPTRLVINDIPFQEWDESGIRQGYVIFPFNFDPRWLKYCLLYNNKF